MSFFWSEIRIRFRFNFSNYFLIQFRSIIKTFVRNYVNGPEGDSNGNTKTEVLIKKRIAELLAVWSNQSNYPCACEGGESQPRNSLSCCKRHRAGGSVNDTLGCEDAGDYLTSTASSSGGKGCVDNFLPPTLNVAFDQIEGENVIAEIVESIPGYLEKIFTWETSVGNSPFRR